MQIFPPSPKVLDTVFPPVKKGDHMESWTRTNNRMLARLIAYKQSSRTIDIKQIHATYQFSIDQTFKKNSYVEWPR